MSKKKKLPHIPELSAKVLNHVKADRKRLTTLTLLLALFVFCILLAAIGLTVLGVFILEWAGVISGLDEEMDMAAIVIFMSVISLILGWVLLFFSIRIPLKPIHTLVSHMNRLAMGDFETRMENKGMLANHPAFKGIRDSFNKLAEELEHTEMLRGDFINNFSHEFKTPIVSIAGFAKLLRRGNLTAEQQAEYLSIIEEESRRLSAMATNVLHLTKIENQSILTDVTTYNLSEQLRSCMLLLEDEWSRKELEPVMEFDEYDVTANEELMRQVFINLIDNAVKFSPAGGEIRVEISRSDRMTRVSVSNAGGEIPADIREKIFRKFYQGDESHASLGNGIGLAIVRRVVQLHKGSVSVQSRGGVNTFTVELPNT